MLEIKNLSASIQGRKIIQDISTVFENGKVNVLLGPNGCGKSTLIRSILHLTRIEQGSILIDGADTKELQPKELAQQIAYMPQSRNVSDISVKRLILHGRFPYLSYPRKYRKCDNEIVEQIMKTLEIDHLADRQIPQLSGGQRQRVYLAMALAQETDIIMMDEPATFLDIQSQLEVMEIVVRLAKEGKNVIMVLHDFESVLRCADRVFLINEGKLIKSGNPEDVLTSKETAEVFGVEVCMMQGEDGLHCYVKRKNDSGSRKAGERAAGLLK